MHPWAARQAETVLCPLHLTFFRTPRRVRTHRLTFIHSQLSVGQAFRLFLVAHLTRARGGEVARVDSLPHGKSPTRSNPHALTRSNRSCFLSRLVGGATGAVLLAGVGDSGDGTKGESPAVERVGESAGLMPR